MYCEQQPRVKCSFPSGDGFYQKMIVVFKVLRSNESRTFCFAGFSLMLSPFCILPG